MGIEKRVGLSERERKGREAPIRQRPQDPAPSVRERSGERYLGFPAPGKLQERIEVVPPCKAF